MKKIIKHKGRVIGWMDDKDTRVIHLHHSQSRSEADASQQSKLIPSTSAQSSCDPQSDDRIQEVLDIVKKIREQQREQNALLRLIVNTLQRIARTVKQNWFQIVTGTFTGFAISTIVVGYLQEVQKELTGNQIKADAKFIRASLDSLGIREVASEGFLRPLFELIWSLLAQ
jgi:hypothetical protein